MATIQGIYVALFGRPADPGGLAYWNGVTNNGSDLSKLIGQLTASQEYLDRFKGRTNAEIVTTIYQSLFGRAPDAGGLDFFTKGLANGTLKLETLAINILDGAQGSDKSIIDNKTAAADLFTKSLDTQAEIDAYKGNGAADLGRAFLTKVTDDKTSIPSQTDVDKAVAGVVTPSGGQGPAGGGGGGSGGGDTPQPQPEKFTVSHTYGDLKNATNGKLYAGDGTNPATGFQKTLADGDNKIIELALDARYRGNGADVPHTSSTDGGAVYNVDTAAPVRFAYSAGISPETGDSTLRLDSYDYKLLIDTDPTAGANFVTLTLVKGNTGDPYPNVSNSPYEWFKDGTAKIIDDGGNESVTQNVQAFDWYNGGRAVQAGDQYEVKLQAYEKGTSTLIAETAIKVVGNSTSNDSALSSIATYSTNKLFVGGGNSNEHFAITKFATGDIELGLNGRIAHGDVLQGEVKSDGLVHYEMASGENARFAYSIASSNDLSAYTFKLKVDTDAGNGTSFTELTLGAGAANSNGKNKGGDSSYTWFYEGQAAIKDDGGNTKVTQNIENISWFDSTPTNGNLAAGHYDVILEAWNGTTLIGTNHVVFDII